MVTEKDLEGDNQYIQGIRGMSGPPLMQRSWSSEFPAFRQFLRLGFSPGSVSPPNECPRDQRCRARLINC